MTPAQIQPPKFHTHHCRSWLLSRCRLPSMRQRDFRPQNCTAVLRLHLLMVWAPEKDNLRPRPTFHIALWQSSRHKTQSNAKLVHCVPPSDRWIVGMEESMDRTVPPSPHNSPTRRLG